MATNLLTGVGSDCDFGAGNEDRAADVLYSNEAKELQFPTPL